MAHPGIKVVLVLLVLSVFDITATSAFGALPDVSITLGGAYPLHLQFNDNEKTRSNLENSGGSKIEGEGLLLLLLLTELGHLGSYELLVLRLRLASGTKPSCKTEGDRTGEILTGGTWHVVLRPTGSLGLLFLNNPLKMTCGATRVVVEGSALSTIEGVGTNENEEFTKLGGKLEGSRGKPAITEYLNENGTILKAKLTSEFGTGRLESAETVVGEVLTEALEGKMFVIKPR
jgi:hypothetical protein